MVAPLIPIAIGIGVAAAGVGRQFLRNLERARQADSSKARAREAYLRLGFAVETLDVKRDAVAAEHVAKARQEWGAARELIMDANTVETADAAYAVIAAGLEQVTLARIALGLEQPPALESTVADSPVLDSAALDSAANEPAANEPSAPEPSTPEPAAPEPAPKPAAQADPATEPPTPEAPATGRQ